jgi:hypothetical protein
LGYQSRRGAQGTSAYEDYAMNEMRIFRCMA